MEKKIDSFLTITVKPGPDFYNGKKHGTHKERAEVFQEYAKRYDVLGSLFTALARYHFRIEPPKIEPEPQGDTDNFTIGDCGSCPTQSNARGIYINGTFNGQCYDCGKPIHK
jgi:hypothetical protein